MSVAGPYPPRQPSKAVRPSSYNQSSVVQSTSVPDPFYGHGETANLSQRFIRALFSCPDRPPPSTTTPPSPTPPLANFVAYALHRTRLHASVTFTALFLLSRLKSRFPAARGSSGHRLFISAFMIASKVVCDDTYSNKSWTVVGQGMFSLREINQMEREMCGYLEWQLNVDPKDLRDFEAKVRKDYAPHGPCPPFVHPPVPVTTPQPPSQIEAEETVSLSQPSQQQPTITTAAAEEQVPMTPPASPHRQGTLMPHSHTKPHHHHHHHHHHQSKPYYPRHRTSVDTSAVPSLNSGDSPSPASSTTCLTPQSDDEEPGDATIVSMAGIMTSAVDYLQEKGVATRSHSALSMSSAASMPPKSKMGRDQSFAFPSRTVW
ncbi:hypothetical protein Clacol_002677 [Clathrus columnatus]|uniref:Cyclin N-terminal domain-containing protein n=1 Tax=Clathrus columnatus TaxID=1419009 RepID=A0AAV5A1G3_9AGAM|nr:hypothetical protein Clacol_002677 [Clathrus columnatus]